MFVVDDVLAQDVTAYGQKVLLRCRKEVLAYAASGVEPAVFRHILLIVRPDFLFSLIYHIPYYSSLKCPGEQCPNVYSIYSSIDIPISAAFSSE